MVALDTLDDAQVDQASDLRIALANPPRRSQRGLVEDPPIRDVRAYAGELEQRFRDLPGACRISLGGRLERGIDDRGPFRSQPGGRLLPAGEGRSPRQGLVLH